MADLQEVPVTESERRGLSALAPLAGVSPTGLTPGVGRRADQLPRRTSSWNCRSSTPKICLNGQKNLRSSFC